MGYAYACQTIGAVAFATSQMNMAVTLSGIVKMADAIFLHARSVVNIMEQMHTGKEGECAKQGGAINCRLGLFNICQTKSITETMAYGAPYHQAYGGDTDAGIVE